MNAEQLSIRGRIGANARLAKYGAEESTRGWREAGYTALNQRLIQEHSLDPEAHDFHERLKFARSAYYGRMALKAAKTRAKKRGQREVRQ